MCTILCELFNTIQLAKIMILEKNKVKEVVNYYLGWVPSVKRKLLVVDNVYETISYSAVSKVINADEWLSSKNAYTPDLYDCDDYVMDLKCKFAKIGVLHRKRHPASLGYIITTNHAFNFLINSRTQIVLIDTVEKKRENDYRRFKSFLNVSNTNIIKLIYI